MPAPISALQPAELSGAEREPFSLLHRRGAWRDALRRRMLAAADVLAIAVASGLLVAVEGGPPLAWMLGLVPVWIVLAKLYGLYDLDHRALRHLTVDELPSILAWVTTASATALLLLSFFDKGELTAATGIRLWAAVLVGVPLARAAARGLWRLVVPPERALLVGSGPLLTATQRKLQLFRDIHVECVGIVDDGDLAAGADLSAARVDRVIVASHAVDEQLIAHLVGLCRRKGLKLSIVPPARAMFGTAVQLHHIADLPFIEYSTWDAARSTLLLKRVLDVVVAGAALVVLAVPLALLAIAVKLDSPGSAFFLQWRAGRNGKPFRVIKLRTMADGADRRLDELIDLEELADPMFKLRNDPRVTRLGRFLRRTSLDELPQLLNVLRGDMSLVGPRPEQLDLVERYADEHRFRLSVKPGLTGPMQVYGRGDLEFDERLAVEREYVENLSLRRDLRILLLTGATVARGHGAY